MNGRGEDAVTMVASLSVEVVASTQWHAVEADQALRLLDSDLESGLHDDEVERRRCSHGRNEVSVSSSRRWWPLLAKQFTGPLAMILFAATAVSAMIGEALDAVVIGVIVVVNGVLGFVQEWRAGKAIEALEAMLVLRSTVRRNGTLEEIDALELVPGDVVELAPGDQVPADLRVMSTANLLVDESALTGESTSVHKTVESVPAAAALAERSSLAYMGTQIMAGTGVGAVVAIGRGTELGTVVELTDTAEAREIPLQRTLGLLARRLGQVGVAIALLTVVVGVASGRPLQDMFLVGVSLAVAVVPEGLPAVVTVTLALGIRTMSKRSALLRHLEAAETLGEASVICTDKTGTLTQNRMSVTEVWTSDGAMSIGDLDRLRASSSVDALLETAQLCNKAHVDTGAEAGDGRGVGDPTEIALLNLAHLVGAAPPAGMLVSEVPFDSTSKAMSVTVESEAGLVTHIKGAPEVVLATCTRLLSGRASRLLTEADRARVLDAQRTMATSGLRTLALARERGDGLEFLGLVGMLDPPRPEVSSAVERALTAGVVVVVMTGDAGDTALSIARQVGLPATEVLTGPDVDSLDDAQLGPLLDGSHVLARVSPAHKMRVVRLLQEQGAVVAMTGDGVNDAPALEQASIGIAMGLRGTDVARGAADLVLADDNFASIVAAIEEGRRQYANIQKFIRYLLSSNLGEVIAVSGSVALGWPLVLLPAQILWMNLLTDGVTALALGVEPAESDAMERPPRRPDESVVGRGGMWWIAGLGSLIGLVTLAVFRLSLGSGTGADLVRAQTLAFTAMVLLETVNVANVRSEHQGIWRTGWTTNPWLLIACGGAVGFQVLAVHVDWFSRALGTSALSAKEWALLVLVAMPILLVAELAKAVHRWRLRR